MISVGSLSANTEISLLARWVKMLPVQACLFEQDIIGGDSPGYNNISPQAQLCPTFAPDVWFILDNNSSDY
eukprot:15356432-Ditylum_brightwellii.AAC.1